MPSQSDLIYICRAYLVTVQEYLSLAVNNTRKYPLRGYFLGVLSHTTALDRLWRGDKTLNFVEYTKLGFTLPRNAVVLVAAAAVAEAAA